MCLPTALASFNSGHNFDLRACCVGMKSSFRPSLVPVRPLSPHSAAWWSSFVVNLNNTTSRCVPTAEGRGLRSSRALPHGGDNDLGAQLHLTLQQLCVKLLHQLLLNFAFLGLEAHEAQVELTFLLFGHIGQGLHNPADHLAHVFGHHHGPLGLLRRRSLGCDSQGCLAFHQLVDRKITNNHERRNVLNGPLHLGQPCQ